MLARGDTCSLKRRRRTWVRSPPTVVINRFSRDAGINSGAPGSAGATRLLLAGGLVDFDAGVAPWCPNVASRGFGPPAGGFLRGRPRTRLHVAKTTPAYLIMDTKYYRSYSLLSARFLRFLSRCLPRERPRRKWIGIRRTELCFLPSVLPCRSSFFLVLFAGFWVACLFLRTAPPVSMATRPCLLFGVDLRKRSDLDILLAR